MKKSSKGQLLISQPGLVDPNFRRTVVLVTEHTKEGAFGLVLNRRTRQTVADLWELLTEKRCESESVTFEGGPVQPGAVFLLHRREDFATGELPVLPGLYLGSDMDLFENLIPADEREKLVALRDLCVKMKTHKLGEKDKPFAKDLRTYIVTLNERAERKQNRYDKEKEASK